MIVYGGGPNFNQLTYEPITSRFKGPAESISSFLRGAAGYLLTSWRLSFPTEAFKAVFLTADKGWLNLTHAFCECSWVQFHPVTP